MVNAHRRMSLADTTENGGGASASSDDSQPVYRRDHLRGLKDARVDFLPFLGNSFCQSNGTDHTECLVSTFVMLGSRVRVCNHTRPGLDISLSVF